MLKNINPLLNSQLLAVLAEMGHGDDLVLVDANFPARSVANMTSSGVLVQQDASDVINMARAILSVYPLDSFVDKPLLRMQVVGAPDEIPEVQAEMQQVANQAEGKSITIGGIERMAFYTAAKSAYAVVATGETRPYGCFILKKGVIFPAGQ